MRLEVLFTSIIIHCIAPGGRSAPIDNSAVSRPSSPRASRDINMRSLSINRAARLSQAAPPFLEDPLSETASDAASGTTDYRYQKVSSVSAVSAHTAISGSVSTLLAAGAVPSEGLGREASYNHASTSTEERTIHESLSSADGEHLRWPRPALLSQPREAARGPYSALSGQFSVEQRNE
jgi:hypothetical protein